MKYALKQRQYRFAVVYETPSRITSRRFLINFTFRYDKLTSCCCYDLWRAQLPGNSLGLDLTVCPISLVHFYTVSYFKKWTRHLGHLVYHAVYWSKHFKLTLFNIYIYYYFDLLWNIISTPKSILLFISFLYDCH